ncbi:MAG: IclR family transcriptional regulator [Blastocatellia bacterium]
MIQRHQKVDVLHISGLFPDMAAYQTEKKSPMSEPKGDVKSLARALELLGCFSTDQPEWGITEIAEYLGIYKSTAHRILITFEQAGFVERTPERRYRLGLHALELGATFRFSSLLIRIAEKPLQVLAEETGSIAHLVQLEGRETIELLRKSGMPAMSLASHPVIRRQAHATSTGKALLAYGGDDAFQRFVGSRQALNKYTRYTITSPEKFRDQMYRIVDDGYAVDDQESCLGIRCLGIPVKDCFGKVVAAISISNSVEKFSDRNLPSLIPHLFATAKTIGARSLML